CCGTRRAGSWGWCLRPARPGCPTSSSRRCSVRRTIQSGP
ncbi:MAG: hypothetical protein AVDCRST_MAG49-3222, partial [uncultured Thermomicrobiales bacterium]